MGISMIPRSTWFGGAGIRVKARFDVAGARFTMSGKPNSDSFNARLHVQVERLSEPGPGFGL